MRRLIKKWTLKKVNVIWKDYRPMFNKLSAHIPKDISEFKLKGKDFWTYFEFWIKRIEDMDLEQMNIVLAFMKRIEIETSSEGSIDYIDASGNLKLSFMINDIEKLKDIVRGN